MNANPLPLRVDKPTSDNAPGFHVTGNGSPSNYKMNSHLLTPREVYQKISASIESVMKGQSVSIRRLLSALTSGGHVLLEDYPGTGKTTLAKVLARSVNATFKRVQFTPDLLPSDIVGVSVFDQRDREFHFHEGPIF